ncbi:MAG TPA: DUF5724 domain-containing protein, partial [Clostridia bacterium]|nr:DUF5724 domain-containing protein [Clostridia bacterium]
AADTRERFAQYFNLAYAFYQASSYQAGQSHHARGFCSLNLSDLGRALELGLIDENEILLELMGRPLSPVRLKNAPQSAPRPDQEPEHPALASAVRKAVDRIVEIESARGEMTTPVSHLAASVCSCYGAKAFVDIVLRMEKDSYVRGYNFIGDDSTRKSMLSHLLKCCRPGAEDDAQALRGLLKGKKIGDARLVDAAMYAPQWMDIMEAYLGWNGLTSAAWYFHAHMNGFFTKEKRSIVARYSSIEPEDFTEGAFDVEWFWDAYRTLGEERFQTVYQSAKYVATGNQHRRAQLFADAVTNRLDKADAEKAILEKRNKDQLLAYALIPIADKRDTLRRYELIQAFLRQAKGFGAQRQAGEATAGRIALANLARNAGYADVNRLMWRMEPEKLAEVSHVFAPQTVEGVALRVAVDASGMASLEVERDGKALKDVPASIKKHALVVQMKAVQQELKQQHARARASLENAMVSEDGFEPSELAELRKHPVIAPLLTHLVFVQGDRHG